MAETSQDRSITLKEYRHKLMAIRARIKYNERNLREFNKHVEEGTFPKRLKTFTIPKMRTMEGQNIVKKACSDLETLVLC